MTPNLDFSRLTREKLDVNKGMDLFLGHDFLSDPTQEFKLAKNSNTCSCSCKSSNIYSRFHSYMLIHVKFLPLYFHVTGI